MGKGEANVKVRVCAGSVDSLCTKALRELCESFAWAKPKLVPMDVSGHTIALVAALWAGLAEWVWGCEHKNTGSP